MLSHLFLAGIELTLTPMSFEKLRDHLIGHLRTRVQNGELTERSLARHTGISQPHIHNVLKGAKVLSPKLADRILATLKISILDLFSSDELRTHLDSGSSLNRYRAAGIRVAIDDYGSGLSSLAYLKDIPATELKIDKAFVLDIADSQRDSLLVRSTIDLGHSLGMQVTAEGVETATALALLALMGCDAAQGYFIGRPMPLRDLLEFLKRDAGQGMQIAPAGALAAVGNLHNLPA